MDLLSEMRSHHREEPAQQAAKLARLHYRSGAMLRLFTDLSVCSAKTASSYSCFPVFTPQEVSRLRIWTSGRGEREDH